MDNSSCVGGKIISYVGMSHYCTTGSNKTISGPRSFSDIQLPDVQSDNDTASVGSAVSFHELRSPSLHDITVSSLPRGPDRSNQAVLLSSPFFAQLRSRAFALLVYFSMIQLLRINFYVVRVAHTCIAFSGLNSNSSCYRFEQGTATKQLRYIGDAGTVARSD